MEKIAYHRILIVFCYLLSPAPLLADDTVDTALHLPLNQEVSANLNSSSDIDYYRIDLPANGNLRIGLRHEDQLLTDSSKTYWIGKIYPENDLKNEIADMGLKGTPIEILENIGLPAGRYYLEIGSRYRYSESPYYLRADFETSEYYEKSPNETVLQANNIKLGKHYSGTLENLNDEDFYYFELTEPGNLSIEMSHENLLLHDSTRTYWTVDLYSEGDLVHELRTLKLQGSPNTAGAFEGLPAGNYYLKIHNQYRYDDTHYTFKVDLTASNYYEKSPNDDILQANTIRLNRQYSGNLSGLSDKDFYVFEITEPGNVQLQLSHGETIPSERTYWRANVFAEGDLTKAVLNANLAGTPAQVEVADFLSAGKYYLEVYARYRQHPGNYQFAVINDSERLPPGEQVWEFPPAGQITANPAIGKDGSLYLIVQNTDVYALNADGQIRWRYTAEKDEIFSSITVGENGYIYLITNGNRLDQLSSLGKLNWHYQGSTTATLFQPVVGKNGLVYLVDSEGVVYGINHQGILQWRRDLATAVHLSPASGAFDTIIVTTENGGIISLQGGEPEMIEDSE